MNILSLGYCDDKLVSERELEWEGVDIKGDRRIKVLSKNKSQQTSGQD